MDCVLGYHLNPLTCGIAKFNTVLADHLNVPHLSLFDPDVHAYRRPLLSIKISEFTDGHIADLERWIEGLAPEQSLRLFFPAYSGSETERRLLARATVVYVGNHELVRELGPLHPNVIESWCPGALLDVQPFAETELSVFSFGMAHKLRVDYYHRLKALLEATGKSYCIYLSTALHEGTSFEGSFNTAYEEMRELFGDRVYFLGFLSDMAVFNYLRRTTYFTAFFPQGVRANNTSINTAMQCGSVVITNLDDDSPADYRHLDSLIDIARCGDRLETDPEVLARIGRRAEEVATGFGWRRLVDHMMGHDDDVRQGIRLAGE